MNFDSMSIEDFDRAIAALKAIKAERQAELDRLKAEVLVLRATAIAHGLDTPNPRDHHAES